MADIIDILSGKTTEQEVKEIKATLRKDAISLLRFIYSQKGDEKAIEWLEDRVKSNDNEALYRATEKINLLADILKLGFK